jgi:Starch-binding associating with outer membrane
MKISKFILVFVLSVPFLTGCKDFLDVNTNPNVPQEAPAHTLLPPLIQSVGRAIQFDARFIGKYNQWYFQNNANTSAWDLHGYDASSDNCGEVWRQHYFALGLNIDLLIADGKKRNLPQYVAIGYALRAWSWQAVADVYGDAIVKQAFDDTRNTFDYDSQEEVYKESERVADLALASVDLKGNADASLAAADQFFAGDMTKWKRFIYGIKARNAHRLTNKTALYKPDAVISFCDQALASNADNATIPYAGTVNDDSNFFGTFRNNWTNFRQSQYIVSLLDGTNPVTLGARDPRLRVMLAPSAAPDTVVRGASINVTSAANIPNPWGTYSGAVVGTAAQAQAAGVRGRYLFHDVARFPIMTYSEIQFIKAEAALRKNDKATALTAFRNAVGAHVDFTTTYANLGSSNAITAVTAAQRTALLADARLVPAVADSLTMDRIMAQKYIALWGWGLFETWNDLRRFHYGIDLFNGQPVYSGFRLPMTFAAANGGKPVYRVRPRFNSEYVWNLDALKKIGGDKLDFHTVELWFTKP